MVSNAAGVEHDPARSSEGLGRDVLGELRSHHTGVAMRAANLAPHHSELGVVDLLLGLVHICHPLAEVELCVLLGANAINLQKSAVGIAVGLAALVAQNQALGIQPDRLLGLLHGLLGDLLLFCSHGFYC